MIQGLNRRRCLSEGHRSRRLYYVQLRQKGTWGQTLMEAGTGQGGAAKHQDPSEGITPAYPPAFLVHGDADEDVPVEAAQAVSQTLIRHGVRHRLMVLRGKGHDFDFDLDEETTESTYDTLWSFFQENAG